MNEGQRFRLGLLKEIHDICSKNGIVYYLAFGTEIGAVRHEGFIPWDDDVDIYMVYDQWERFKEACKTDLPPNRYVGSADEDDTYGHIIPRYVATDTTSVHINQSLTDSVAGEVIDIFILDPIGDGEEEWRSYLYDAGLYGAIANYARCVAWRAGVSPEDFDAYAEIQRRHGRARACRELNERIKRHHDENGSYYAVRYHSLELRYERAWFGDPVPVSFEGHEFWMPRDPARLLAFRYGDYWFKAPAKLNPAKHSTASSLRLPYVEALQYYRPLFNREEFLVTVQGRQRLVLETGELRRRVMDERARAILYMSALPALKSVADHRAEIEKAIREKDGYAIRRHIGAFMEAQSSKDAIGNRFDGGTYRMAHPIIATDDESLLEAAVVGLFATGDIDKAMRILEVCKQEQVPFTASMNEVWEAVMRLRECMALLLAGKNDESLSIAASLSGEFPDASVFLQLRCVSLIRLAEMPSERNERLGELRSLIACGRERWPEDGFFLWAQARIGLAYGSIDDDRALELFLQASENTRDVFVIRDIEDRTGYLPENMRLPEWAREAGAPQWSGPEVKPLPLSGKAADQPIGDDKQRYLFQLLLEVCGICDKHSIRYVLSPEASRSFILEASYPLKLTSYSIACSADDAKELLDLLISEDRPNRKASREDSDSQLHGGSIRYYGTDSLRISFAGARVNSDPYLYVTIRLLDSDDEFLLDATKYGFSGHSLSAPRQLDDYVDGIRSKVISGTSLDVGKKMHAAVGVNLGELLESGKFSLDYYENQREFKARIAPSVAINKEFKANYERIKLSVELKERSLDKIPGDSIYSRVVSKRAYDLSSIRKVKQIQVGPPSAKERPELVTKMLRGVKRLLRI